MGAMLWVYGAFCDLIRRFPMGLGCVLDHAATILFFSALQSCGERAVALQGPKSLAPSERFLGYFKYLGQISARPPRLRAI
jgi:hypothetical protein